MQDNTPVLNPVDRVIRLLLAIYAAAGLLALSLIPLRFLPAEDAIILFQYSRNLALTGAITFNQAGPHVEGATDFAWMLLTAAAIRLGLSPLWLSAAVNVLCTLLLSVLLLKLANLRPTLLRILPIAGAILLMPQILAAASGFAVLPDAVFLTALVLFVTRKQPAPAALTALLFCLFRPDAVVFVLPLLAGLILTSAQKVRATATLAALFLLPGAAYFLWRWHYFHEFLPLPFLVKSDTPRVLHLFVPLSLHQSLMFVLFAAASLAPVLLRRSASHLWLLIPLCAVPTLFFWSMRLDQNVAARFFYYLPLAAAILIALNWPSLQTRRTLILRTAAAAWLVLLALPFSREIRTFRDEQFTEVKSISEALSHLPTHGTILTSEAGFLPYFSHWQTVDAWGLNTPQFAHHFFQSSDVERLHPDLIVLHPDRTESCTAVPTWSPTYPDRSWQHLTRNLISGSSGHYDLWLTSYGSEYYRQRKHWQYGEGDRECWLVRRDSPLQAQLTQILNEHHTVPPPR